MPNPLLATLLDVADRPFKSLVEHKMKNIRDSDLAAAVLHEWRALPKSVTLHEPPDLDGGTLEKLETTLLVEFADEAFWASATCDLAWASIIVSLDDILGLSARLGWDMGSMNFNSLVDADDEIQDTVVGLFELATDFFAYMASGSKQARQSMGIRKGLFG